MTPMASGKLQLELEDGTLVNFRKFEGIPINWNWRDDAEYRYVERGDTLWVSGYFSYFGDRKDKRVEASDVEFLFRGNDTEFAESYVLKFARYGGYLEIAISVLSLLSAVFLRLESPETTIPEKPGGAGF